MSRPLTCIECGMAIESHVSRCPKCDNRLDLQTDGSTVTIDIAHEGERVRDAMKKLRTAVRETKPGIARYLRVIVGTGVIREEVMLSLREMEHRKHIIQFHLESENSGAFLVQLKP